jgi:AmpD protein
MSVSPVMLGEVDAEGWLPGVRIVASPNCDSRPPGENISLIVIHAISLPPGEFGGNGIIELFSNQLNPHEHPYYEGIHALRVSAHFLIRRDGAVIQFVPCTMRAWHAGISCWQGRTRCNDFSIGIELEGCDEKPFEAVQYQTLNTLISTLRRVYPQCDVTGHADIAPERKTDPGPFFDWARLEA